MRIKKILAKDILPVKLFEVDNLSDLVVIAGPNGVGKTRLISGLLHYMQNFSGTNTSFVIEATNTVEEQAFGGKSIDTANQADAQKLKALLQKNRRRRNLTSSIVYFESNRSIQNVNSLGFQFEFPDPYDEELGWNMSFSGLVNRWQDTQHAIFKKVQSQKTNIASRAIQLRKDGYESMNLDFTDPLDPFRKTFYQLLGPKSLAAADIQRQTLTYEHNGEIRDINTLSSGEREVLNITFDFLLRKPSDCIVFFDEPELHLHPELLSRLISTLKDIGTNNQFILISHSPDVISASLDDSVIFLMPPKQEGGNQGVLVTAQDTNTEVLSRLGQSVGVVSLGKKIVLIEGASSSLDKQTYAHILKNQFSNLVLLPSGGKGNLYAFEQVLETVLSRSIWGVQFYMLADRDALPVGRSLGAAGSAAGRLKTLNKYHLENYFLDAETICLCFKPMEEPGHWLRNPSEIDRVLREIAAQHIPYAAALIASKHFRDRVGNIDVMVKGATDASQHGFVSRVLARVGEERERVRTTLDDVEIQRFSEETYQALSYAVSQPGNAWKSSIPGKPILSQFCTRANIPLGRLKTLYIQSSSEVSSNPFAEIYEIFDFFSKADQ